MHIIIKQINLILQVILPLIINNFHQTLSMHFNLNSLIIDKINFYNSENFDFTVYFINLNFADFHFDINP